MPAAATGTPHFVEHRLQHRADLVPLRQVAGEGVLRTNGLAYPICLDRSLVVATCHAVVVVRCLTEVPGQEVERLCPQVKTGADAEAVHLGRGHRAHAVELANRQILHEGRPHLRGDDEQPVRFAVIGGELGQELIVRHARRRGQAGFRSDRCPDLGGDRGGRAAVEQGRGHVQVGLIQRQRLDQRRVAREYGVDLRRHGFVDFETWRDEHQVRALTLGRDGWHGRTHAEPARLVARRRHHPAFPTAADRHRPAAQARVIALLDGRVEGVHVDVDDAPKRLSLDDG